MTFQGYGARRTKKERVAIGVVLPLLGWFLFLTINLSFYKYYSIDEFQYSHGAWLVSKGFVPFKDFFDHHFPFIHQVLSIPFMFLGDNPNNIYYLRLCMLPFLLLILGSMYFINSKKDDDILLGLITPTLLLANWAFITKATEIRPDTLAFAFFISAIAVLYKIHGSLLRGFLVGLLLALACWGSQKVFYYGLAFLAAFLIDVIRNRKYNHDRYLLGSPLMLSIGFLVILLPIFIYLFVTKSYSDWFYWCIEWAFIHERYYPGFSWTRYFLPFLTDYWWLLILAAVGLHSTVKDIFCGKRNCWSNPDLVLAGALVSSFVSYAASKGPFVYTLIPFFAMVAIFAGRGVIALLRQSWQWISKEKRLARVSYCVFCAFLLTALAIASLQIQRFIHSSNAYQHQIFSEIDKLTNPQDSIYDNCGGYVTRPHAYYYFFTDALLRKTNEYLLERKVPEAILESECVMVLHDVRFQELSENLKSFVYKYFQPFNGDIRLWGQQYRVPPSQTLESEFLAIKSGRYFIDPPSLLEGGELKIDGKRVSEPIFETQKGPRKIQYIGKEKEFFILWLPRDNKRYHPRFDLPPRFSILL